MKKQTIGKVNKKAKNVPTKKRAGTRTSDDPGGYPRIDTALGEGKRSME